MRPKRKVTLTGGDSTGTEKKAKAPRGPVPSPPPSPWPTRDAVPKPEPGVRNKAAARADLLDPILNRAAIERRIAELDQPHSSPLKHYVEGVRRQLDPRDAATVPWFDPRSGGTAARVLLLLQDPSKVAAGSGFISPDNNDVSAQNITIACDEAGLSREVRLHWNVYPWWVKNKAGTGQTYEQAGRRSRPWLQLLLRELLAELEVVVLLGGHAQTSWKRLGDPKTWLDRPPQVLRAPHPSAQAWNNLDRELGVRMSVLTIDALRRAAQLVA